MTLAPGALVSIMCREIAARLNLLSLSEVMSLHSSISPSVICVAEFYWLLTLERV